MPASLDRRAFLAATVYTVACARQLATRYFGWLYIASASERAIAVADLSEFRRVRSIPLPQAPAQVIRAGQKVFVTSPEAHAFFEIDTVHQQLARKAGVSGTLVNATAGPSGDWIAAITSQPDALLLLNTADASIAKRIALPRPPGTLDVSATLAAVASASDDTITRISLPDGKVLGTTNVGSRCGTLRIGNNGEAIILGSAESKQILTLDAGTGRIIARMPLSFAPSRFCFSPDGGQMFVTGSGEDSMAIVSPFQSQIDQTIVAGQKPDGMAVAAQRNLLLVTNPGSGDLTILDIETRHLAASVHIGGVPGEVMLTPNDEYALIVNRQSGDVSVIRLATVLARGDSEGSLRQALRAKPLFTVFPTAANPQSAAIIPADA